MCSTPNNRGKTLKYTKKLKNKDVAAPQACSPLRPESHRQQGAKCLRCQVREDGISRDVAAPCWG